MRVFYQKVLRAVTVNSDPFLSDKRTWNWAALLFFLWENSDIIFNLTDNIEGMWGPSNFVKNHQNSSKYRQSGLSYAGNVLAIIFGFFKFFYLFLRIVPEFSQRNEKKLKKQKWSQENFLHRKAQFVYIWSCVDNFPQISRTFYHWVRKTENWQSYQKQTGCVLPKNKWRELCLVCSGNFKKCENMVANISFCCACLDLGKSTLGLGKMSTSSPPKKWIFQ